MALINKCVQSKPTIPIPLPSRIPPGKPIQTNLTTSQLQSTIPPCSPSKTPLRF